MKKALRHAIKITLPIFLGYVPLGIAFGLMLQNAGYNVLWALISSVSIYSGTGQFVEVSFLDMRTAIYEVALIAIILNSRMMFYGLSFLERFAAAGKRKWYLIFALTDETYALLCAVKKPEDVKDGDFMLAVSMLNQSYWVLGGVIGVLAGTLIGVDTKGVDFIMTALFVVLAMDQWKAYASHLPAIIGLVSGLSMLALFGPENFLIPALVLITLLLIIFRRRIEGKAAADE